MRASIFQPAALAFSALAAVTLAVPAVLAAADDSGLIVSQKDRQFNPQTVTIQKGQSLTIVNDDGDLMHHAYVESDAFNFDSGDQKPGSRTPVAFPVRGDFQVLCGIHPKMKLTVHVR